MPHHLRKINGTKCPTCRGVLKIEEKTFVTCSTCKTTVEVIKTNPVEVRALSPREVEERIDEIIIRQ